MKAMRHSPEWNPMPDKNDKHAQMRLKKAQALPTPYSDMTDVQIHVRGRLPSGARAEYRAGKGSETLFIDMGDVRSEEVVMHKASLVHANFVGKKQEATA